MNPAAPLDADGQPEKRPGAYRTIGEVADDLGVPQHVLRFWEGRFPQVQPLKRAGGRRYYRPADIALLKGIRSLLHGRGYTIKGAQRVLRENGPRFVEAVGRGEAEADPPRPGDRESAATPATVREALRDALEELRGCRSALAALREDDPAA